MIDEFSLSSLTMVTPHRVQYDANIRISNGRIKDFSKSNEKDYPIEGSYILFPALINAHDHLFGSYHPKIGEGPYLSWLPWDYDLKSSDVYKERNKNEPFVLYLVGSYKNLISGVTTVHDHIPHEINDSYIENLPIRVLREYTLSHEASSYDLKWGKGIGIEHSEAVKKNIPYVTHIEEGFDQETLRGIDILEKHKALSDHTVLIHCVGCSEEDIRLIAKRKAHFVWCVGSNMYMFQKTANIKSFKKAGVNISIGTDSPASGEINLLEELRYAKKIYRDLYGEDLSDREIVEMITINPAHAFRIDRKLGSLEKNKLGDLLLISGDGSNPYSSLVNAKFKDIALVFMEGKPLYGDRKFEHIFKDLGTEYTQMNIENSEKLVIGDPKNIMENLRKTVGFRKELPFLPI